ncbi:hypothetical protein CRG98_044193 [Punica granatum]|uniref:Uncharacterized protein n=1 Tax=Punica granatum TaxID=22663 RepID=A0A2I0HUX8_PUNGR|nr:hypothetical protein CRG98_044193 [Punica granatum]
MPVQKQAVATGSGHGPRPSPSSAAATATMGSVSRENAITSSRSGQRGRRRGSPEERGQNHRHRTLRWRGREGAIATSRISSSPSPHNTARRRQRFVVDEILGRLKEP